MLRYRCNLVTVEESVRPTIESGYYERSVPPFLAQGRGKGASSTLMPQARLYVESPFLSASHAGHCKPPKMKTSSIPVISQTFAWICLENTGISPAAPVKVRLTLPVTIRSGRPPDPPQISSFLGYRTHATLWNKL